MSSRILLILLCLLSLTGCDKIKSWMGTPADPKELDAQAIGYACRVSKKPPELCMKENDAQSPSQILNGWKNADKDIKARVIELGPNGELLATIASAVTPASAVARPPEEKK
jgi:ribosome modulation factor